MSGIAGGPNIVRDDIVLWLDGADNQSFRGEPTTNTVVFPGASAGRYNNPGFSGTIVNTGQTFMGSPIWEVTFIPQDSARIPRLGSTEGFGFLHGMGTRLFPNTQYMSSIYVKSEYPLQNSTSQGFNNTYSNIPGWGFDGTSTTRLQEGEWTRMYTKYLRNTVIDGVSYIDRSVSNTLNAIVNTNQTTQVLVTVTIQSNGTFSTSTDFGTSTAGGTITDYSGHVGLRSANPNITNAGGISGLSTGTSAIVNHGLNTSTWTKMSDVNPVFRTSYPFQYYVLMNIPSTVGNNATVSFNLSMSGFYSSVSDNKFWKVTFDTSSLQVNDVIRTYWTAPMIEEHSRNLPSRFTVGTRGTTVATGGGWIDLSGNTNHGTLDNGPIFNNENQGSIEFDGVDDRIECGTFNVTPHLTINTWVYKTSSAVNQGICRKQNVFALSQSSGTLRVAPGTNWTFFDTGYTIPLNQWVNITYTYDGTTQRVYINGSSIFSNTSASGNLPSNSNQVRIGFDDNNWWWGGRIASTKIYNRSLTAEEVLQNYNATKYRFGI
jgi:hypothetical protein